MRIIETGTKSDRRMLSGRLVRPSQAAFTIAELIVAIGVTVVLILGIARIFTMSKNTVSIGNASAEVSQYSRALERMLRHDLHHIIAGDGFLVIRNERIGTDAVSKFNHREGIYLNPDAEEAGDSIGNSRLDQLVFFAAGDFPTYQYYSTRGTVARNEVAPVARIWYGHGYRKPGLVTRDPDDRTLEEWEIKNLGQPGPNEFQVRFADDNQPPIDPANKYAQDWILARQQLLLLPREQIGNPDMLEGGIVPSVFELFNEIGSVQFVWPYSTHDYDPALWENRLSPGYADIVDADLESVEKAVSEYGIRYNYQSGEYETVADPLGGDWKQDADNQQYKDAYWNVFNTLGQDQDIQDWWMIQQRRRMRMACGRMRVETYAPSTDRVDQMLTQASFIPGCSEFKVQWSSGDVDAGTGEMLWFDIEHPANPNVTGDLDRSPIDPTIWFLSELTPYGTNPAYDREWKLDQPYSELQAQDLYYATFGNFIPKEGDADRSDAWPWPALIRIQVRLHDHRGVLTGGRTFEYQFALPENDAR